MKKAMLLGGMFSLFLLLSGSVKGQMIYDFTPFNQFKGDTLAYIKANYWYTNSRYDFIPPGLFFQDAAEQLPFKAFHIFGLDGSSGPKIFAFIVYFDTPEELLRRAKNGEKIYKISCHFEKTIYSDLNAEMYSKFNRFGINKIVSMTEEFQRIANEVILEYVLGSENTAGVYELFAKMGKL